MSAWEVRIDGTGFIVVAMYLWHPDSPIQYILHVRDRAMLAEVAARIERDSRSSASPRRGLSSALRALVQAGAIKVSARQGLEGLDPSAIVDAARVCPSAPTEVIFLPPYYLAHTPGLFEGKLFDSRQTAKDQGLCSAPAARQEQPGGTLTGASVVESEASAAAVDEGFARALEFIKCLKSDVGSGSQ